MLMHCVVPTGFKPVLFEVEAQNFIQLNYGTIKIIKAVLFQQL
jgi:hypothetical protein